MNLSRFLKVIFLFLILISLEFLFLTRLEISDKSIESIPNKKEYLNPISVQGLTVTRFKGNQILTKVTAKELKINPRKFNIFNIKPFNELTLNKVTIEFYKSKDEPSGIDLGDLIYKFSSRSNGKSSSSKGNKFEAIKTGFGAIKPGLITRGVINKLVLKIYNKNNLSMIIKAPTAYVNFKRNKVIFQNATVEDIASREIIKSRKVVLKCEENALYVPGQYVLLSPTGFREGRDLKINL
jgi:hypothetical protein